jgi:hypothetical protein
VKGHTVAIVACLLAALVGAAGLSYAMPHGPAVSSDGVVYLLSADNLVKGDGFGIVWGSGRFHPLAGYPPLYPLLVALAEFCGLGMLAAARAVGVAAYFLTILGLGLAAYRATRSLGLALTISVFLLTSPLLFGQYANAGSEGVFYLAGMLGLAVILEASESDRMRDWAAAGFLSGLAFLTRYVGVAFIFTGVIWAAAAAGGSLRRRLARAGILGAIPAGLMLPWLAWTMAVTGTIGERRASVVTDLLAFTEPLRAGLIDLAWDWLPVLRTVEASYRLRGMLVLGLGALLVVVVFAVVLGVRGGRLSPLGTVRLAKWSGLFFLFGVVYTGVHVMAYITTQPTPDVSERLLTPLYLSAVWATAGVLWILPALRPGGRLIACVPALLLAVLLVPSGMETAALSESLRESGGGFNTAYWRSSPAVEAIRGLPPGTPIISHAADALIFLTGRPTYWIPELMRGTPDPGFSRFGDHPERSEEEEAFRYRKGVLVVFPWIQEQLGPLYGDAAAQRARELTEGLRVYFQSAEGEVIYLYP